MEKNQLDLCRYRLEKSKEDLNSSKLNLDHGKISTSINRSYYSMFHAVRALLTLNKFDSKKHSGIISHFNQFYIKPGFIEPKYFKMLTTAFQIRRDSDYDDFFIAVYDEAKIQYDNACLFFQKMEDFINKTLSSKKRD